MRGLASSLLSVALLWHLTAGGLGAQTRQGAPRPLSPGLTGCDSSQAMPTDSVYQADAVDQPVRPMRLRIEWVPFRSDHVLKGQSAFRFIVEASGKINRCSIVLLQESAPQWTEAVVRELRSARYQPARHGGQKVRQLVEQLFTYYSDGRAESR
jgi:hypothetical protein